MTSIPDQHSTAQNLSDKYKKWEEFNDNDLDELDDEEFDDAVPSGFDLDAITGPKEEVSKIRAHWNREYRKVKRHGRYVGDCKASDGILTRPSPPSLPATPVIARPSEYLPIDDPQAASAKAIARDYDRWTSFDADAALLALDNEGTTEEGNAMRCTSTKGSATFNLEGYTKDREEYDLDQEIEQHVGGLKKVLAQNLKDASNLKLEGNEFLRAGRAKEAADAYVRGLHKMALAQQSFVLMADSMSEKQTRLVADLYRNLAAAKLTLSDFSGALDSCDEALKLGQDSDNKALYRRSLALLGLGRLEEADKTVSKLDVIDPTVRRLHEKISGLRKNPEL